MGSEEKKLFDNVQMSLTIRGFATLKERASGYISAPMTTMTTMTRTTMTMTRIMKKTWALSLIRTTKRKRTGLAFLKQVSGDF